MKRIGIIYLLLTLFGWGLAAKPTPGNGWSVNPVCDGIVYYSFSGMDEISGAMQQVFIIDQDLSNPRYALRFSHSEPDVTTSEVFLRNRAVAAMNACYEASSVVVKVNGVSWSNMPFNTVFKLPVPNWKSEAAVYTDGMQNVSISFDGKGMNIEERRAFYAASAAPNIFSSAPMLIDDYEPVGAFFVDSTLTKEQLKAFNYEDPIRHQGVRHPRTAVAKTTDNHLLLVAVDGRWAGVSEGMNARELTRFLEKWFHPQYALNMDGGGSTTLCVRGYGDEKTHVVNYPTDNKKFDHAGQRRRDTHFYIVEVEPEVSSAPLRENVREEVRADRMLAAGLDGVYDFSPKTLTPAPKGYEPVYISHYGRHGSRYAYTSKTYTVPLEMLREGAEKENLTDRGRKLLEDLEAFWVKGQYQVGDLTPLGWEQLDRIAGIMVHDYPSAFRKGSRIDACSSSSVRSVVSMASCCAALSREAPKASVYAHQSVLDIQATRPNIGGKNPFRYTGPDTHFPYPESSEAFFLRRFPNYSEVLGRLFKDPSAGLGKHSPYDDVFFYYYMFIVGMNSLPEEVRIEVDDLVTNEELAVLWEVDNYERFREYLPYRLPCSSIVDDIVAKADARLSEGSRGADLRFGHDHVAMALFMIMDLDGFGYIPPAADDLAKVFQTFRSPMATNIQFIFYTPKRGKAGDPLVKVLLNGEEAKLGALAPKDGPYYSWPDVREYLRGRVARFVN